MTMGLYPSPYPPYPPELDLDDLSQAREPLVRTVLLALCDDEGTRARALHYLGRLLEFENETRGSSFSGSASSAAARRGADDLRSPTATTATTAATGATATTATTASSGPAGAGGGNPRKRKKTGDPTICVQCDGIFVEEENEHGACSYHSGILQVFDETKVDPGMSEVDTPYNRIAFPEAFRWICCMNSGSAKTGCRRGRHESNPDLSRKGRGGGDSQDSSLDGDPLSLDQLPASSEAGYEEDGERGREGEGDGEAYDGNDGDGFSLRPRQESADVDNGHNDQDNEDEDQGDDDDDDQSRSGRVYGLYGREHSGSSGIIHPLTTRTAVPASGTSLVLERDDSGRKAGDNRRRREPTERVARGDAAAGPPSSSSSSRRKTRG